MKPRLLIVLTLLVVLPLSLLAWLGGRAVYGEQARLREGFQAQMIERLTEVQRSMAGTIAARERELAEVLAAIPSGAGPEAWRDLPRQHRLVSAAFVLDARGRMLHPPKEAAAVSSDELAFLQRTDGLWDGAGFTAESSGEFGAPSEQGWKVWYHGSGPRFIFWMRLPGGEVVGAEIPTAVLTADIIGKLPMTATATTAAGHPGAGGGRVLWSDPQGRTVYAWGTAPDRDQLSARLAAPAPFAAWSLDLQAPDVTAAGGGGRWPWWTGLAAAAAALGLLAVYLYRESTRELRTAAQRITFVNQVSHELKTPLTNISLYAELAAARLPEDDGSRPVRECLDVVVSESARLGRLITNVLTFSRHQRGTLRPQARAIEMDDEIAAILQPFRPGLAEQGVALDARLASRATALADPDWLGQIVSNLLSNVEKYAGSGGWAGVTTRVDAPDRMAEVVVADRGPGIPSALREKVFEPFFRASDRLTDGVAGTGLGLGLARELARAMGGDLVLDPPPGVPGCTFVLRLPLAPS